MNQKLRVFFRVMLMVVCFITAVLFMALFWPGWRDTVYSATVYESPYVTFSPDGKAFTTNYMDRNIEWYEYGTEVETGISSSLRGLKEGEHYYKAQKSGELPVGKWRVEYQYGTCCHTSYPTAGGSYHGISFERKVCKSPYFSGWVAYCADCEETLLPYYVYMSKEAAQTVKKLDSALDYFYLCPFCRNLEQGVSLSNHWCRKISQNRYQVCYDSNASEGVGGYMESSFHMYNNATEFEGRKVIPQKQLSKNTYTRIGYEFTGWNTKPDGSGTSFADREEIWNLSTENYDGLGSGVVVLYAQWKKSESWLQIDPSGGSYKGNKGITEVKGEYGSTYEPEIEALDPPYGALVSFQTNGGKTIEPIRGTMKFEEWLLGEPFWGRFQDGIYYYEAPGGSVDRLSAVYERMPVVLPQAQKEGYSFGGWYFDEECTIPAGNGGDTIVPGQDITLYAKWAELVLVAVNNGAANGGKGAVDLSWSQSDGRNKTYMIYQSMDNAHWTLVSDSEDISNHNRVNRSFAYSGKEQTYIVPYTGLYTLTAAGAQGNDYEEYKGGLGGSVTGTVWLEKGEQITYNVGGSNGYNGGGDATGYGNGGGATTVTSDKKGLLMVAGGGGGASGMEDGGDGGSSAGNVADGMKGEKGVAGGGGGYLGGTGAEIVYHYHSDQCYVTTDSSYVAMAYPDVLGSWAQKYSQLNYCYYAYGSYYGESKNIWDVGAHGKERKIAGTDMSIGEYLGSNTSRYRAYIPTEGNQKLHIHITADTFGGIGGLQDGSLLVYDQNEQIIFQKQLSEVKRYTDVNGFSQSSIDGFLDRFDKGTGGKRGSSSGWYYFYDGTTDNDDSAIYWNETVELPEETTGVRIRVISQLSENETWFSSTIQEISFSGSKTVKVCNYEKDGELVSSRPSFGGSSYVNTRYITDYTKEAGSREGNGMFQIESIKIGYREELFLKGVKAPDQMGPESINRETVSKRAVEENKIELSWEEPKDHGTDYYHRAESYLLGSTEILSHSNVTKNTLITGVAAYYYLADGLEDSEVTDKNGTFTKLARAEIVLEDGQQYFHVAAVDKAGNLSKTTHVPIGRADEEVAWPMATDPLTISSEHHSVYPAGSSAYYVKCDGKTPFRLDFAGFLLGQASAAYQVNHLMYRMQVENESSVTMDVFTPNAPNVIQGTVLADAGEVTKTFTGKTPLQDDSYTMIRRSQWCRKLSIEQRFTMEPSMNGKKLWVVPVAGGVFQEKMITSDWNADKEHGLWLIGDNEPPVITGIEAMENYDGEMEAGQEKAFFFQASDTGSGVAEFYAVVTNHDNGSRKEFRANGGDLMITIKETDELFHGDFMVEFYAADQVGNEETVSCTKESFALSVYVERILQPHNPVFRGGESGNVHITVYGYPDKVEVIFSKEMTALDSELDTVFTYDGTRNRCEEAYSFMVPLSMPQGQYEILVNAWKGGKVISRTPLIVTLAEEENILKDMRTRLR